MWMINTLWNKFLNSSFFIGLAETKQLIQTSLAIGLPSSRENVIFTDLAPFSSALKFYINATFKCSDSCSIKPIECNWIS